MEEIVENLEMKIRKITYISCTILIATGCLVILLTTLSFSTAASELSTFESSLSSEGNTDRWIVLSDMRSGRGDPGVVVHKNKIHVISGFFSPGYNYSSSQEIYDPQTDTWLTRWGVPVPRSDMMVATVNDKIYAIGGWRCIEDEYCGTIGLNHMYDPILDTWITKTSMITPVSGAGVVVFSDTIQIIGGYNHTLLDSIKSVQIYNPGNDTWTQGTPLPSDRSGLSAVVLDGMIYAVGGNGSSENYPNPTTNIVEIYDPSSDSWKTGPALPEPRASMAVTVRDGKIFVIGGTDNWSTDNVVDTTFVYDPKTGLWSTITPMPTARRSCEAAVVGDFIYVIGGAGEDGAGFANEAYGDKPISTTTTITSDDPDPSQENQYFMVSYSVTSTEGIPSGIVTTTIGSGDENCILPLVDGIGSCEMTLNKPGVYTITARYSGDEFYAPSNGTENHLVIPPKLFLPLIVK